MRKEQKRRILTAIIALVMIAAFAVYCLAVQMSTACRQMNDRAERYFRSITEIYDTQTNVTESLYAQKEDVILHLVRSLSSYYDAETFRRARLAPENQPRMLQKLCDSTDVLMLLVVDDEGKVLFGSDAKWNGVSLIENGVFTRETFDRLLERESSDPSIDIFNDPDVILLPDTEDSGVVCAPYSAAMQIDGERCHVIALADFVKLLGDMGFMYMNDFALDTGSDDEFMIAIQPDMENIEESLILRGVHGNVNYAMQSFYAIGLSRNALADGYAGVQRLDGKYYYCRSANCRVFSSDMLIVAACSLGMMLDIPALILPVAVLAWFYLYLFAYGIRMRRNTKIVLPEGDLLRDYAHRLSVIALTGTLIVFLAAFYCQTLSGISLGIRQTKIGQEILSSEMESVCEQQETVLDARLETGISQVNLIRMTVEARPELYFSDADPDAYREYAVTDENGYSAPLSDEFGHPLRSVRESEGLRALCGNFDLNRLTLYNADGYAVSDSGSEWYAHIERDQPETAALFEVLDRRRDSLFAMDDSEENLARIAVPMDYYVRDTNGETEFVTADEYRAYREDPENTAPVRRRYGLLVCEQNVPEILFDTESDALSFVVGSREKVQDCKFIVADSADEHAILYADGVHAETAADLGLSEAVFSGDYNGFLNFGGERYFVCARAVDSEEMNDPFVISMYPLSVLYGQRLRISVLIWIGSAILLALLTAALLLIQRARDRAEMSDDPPVRKNRPDTTDSRISLTVIALTLAAALLTGGEWADSGLRYILSGLWQRGVNLFSLSMCAYMILALILLSRLLQLMGGVFRLLTPRGETLARLVVSTLKYGAGLFVIFYSLYLFGLDTASVLRSLGVFSLIVGLGAQSLIKDIIAGIFVVFEGAYHVGDIVQIKGFRGRVNEIALRTTKVENLDGNVMIFSNSSVSDVENLSLHSSCVYCNLHIPAERNPDEIREKILAELPEIQARIPEIKGEIEYDGITDTDANGYVVRLIARCRERDRGTLWRRMNQEIINLNRKLDLR